METLRHLVLRIGVWLFAAGACLSAGLETVYADMPSATSQTIYLSAYPKLEGRRKEMFTDMIHIVSIRNTDRTQAIVVDSINYHDAKGKLKREILNSPLSLAPLASQAFRLNAGDLESDAMTGCFLVTWRAGRPVSTPLAETLVGYVGGGGSYSFVFTGVVLEGTDPPPK